MTFHPYLRLSRLHPLARHLLGADVETIPNVDQGDCEDQCCEGGLVIMACHLLPDLIRYRVGPITEPRHRFGESQRSALGVREIGRVSPGCYGEQTFVCFSLFLERAAVHVNANAAAIDLARPQLDQTDRRRRNASFIGHPVQGMKGVHGVWKYHYRILHSCLHDCIPPITLFLRNEEARPKGACCHICRVPLVTTMTD